LETIALFPLSTVLFPGGRLPLQIFEPRYVDLISASLKNDSGFGVVCLLQGAEVFDQRQMSPPSFTTIGTYVKVIDWNSLPNNRLAVTVEGVKKFRLLSSYQQADNLHRGEIEWIAPEQAEAAPADCGELKSLLSQLNNHPQVQKLSYDVDITEAPALGYLLAQLLPIDNKLKYQLLRLEDPLERLQSIGDLLEHLSR